METIKLNIDGKEIETKTGKTILEAALDAGIYIPHLCHHPDLKPIGTCGICVVDVEGIDEPPTSCTTPAESGMVVKTKTSRIEQMRRQAMELLLVDHPPKCTECSQYLNCELQSVKQYLGIAEDLTTKTRVKPIPVNRDNPLFVHDLIRCIKCERCVRACNELRGVGVLQLIEEDGKKHIRILDDKTLAEAGCRFCGACVEVCPTGAMRDREELMEGKKRRHALIPCHYTCPAGIDVPRYVHLVREKRYAEATAVIREKVPFPKVLGYVCNHPCEEVCRRREINEAISIRELKRFAAENDQERLWEKNSRKASPTNKRVAVVGSGPAGLTAAYYLAKLGHRVTVFESLPLAGGMMRYGIPAYRLPREALDSEIQDIEKAGVDIKTNTKVGSLDTLMLDEGYDAVLVAIGTHESQKLPIPGADLDKVLMGLSFLRDLNLGKEVKVGKRVLVLGGGNVAFDCARMAIRMGAQDVHLACVEAKETMPGACDEIEQGEDEGIVIHPSKTFTRIISENGRTTGVECLDVTSFEFDEYGRLHMDVIEGSEHVLPADTVIFAIGQRPEIPDSFELDLDETGHIEVDPYTFDTSREGVYAAGDAVTGTVSVIEAVASGRKGASAVDRYLGGSGEIDETSVPKEDPETWLGPGDGFAALSRCKERLVRVEDRIKDCCSIVQEMNEKDAVIEASRCLRCDLRLKITPVRFWGDY
ncbi:MAG: FAD-dependent oxidoreductase [Deltaproteobacteria bacterium]|nr:MAG: FAD-dependent oxidoreductase [Deltaproteobacteria bacterium]